jgi:hypothetical protein
MNNRTRLYCMELSELINRKPFDYKLFERLLMGIVPEMANNYFWEIWD